MSWPRFAGLCSGLWALLHTVGSLVVWGCVRVCTCACERACACSREELVRCREDTESASLDRRPGGEGVGSEGWQVCMAAT